MKRFFLITGLLLRFSVLLFAQLEQVTVQWGPLELTYNGSPQVPTATATNSAGVDVPLIVIAQSMSYPNTDADTYYADALLVYPGTYLLDAGASGKEYYILPYECPIQWANTSFTYNGSPQLPTATTTDIYGGNLPLDVTLRLGYNGIDAGVQRVVANFNPYQNNYTISEVPVLYTISPATRNVQWGNTSFDWNGTPQVPTATATDLFGTPFALTITGQQTNVGSYLATATLSTAAPNYVLGNETTTFSIGLPPNPLIFLVHWDSTPLTYNGYPQAPTASAANYQGDNLQISILGQGTDVGKGYTAVAYPNDPNYQNVTLLNNSSSFDISPASINVKWGNTSLPFNGKPQAPTATATGVLSEDLPLNTKGLQTDIGTGYTATASFLIPNYNYSLSNLNTKFEITPAPITVHWGNTTLTYNGYPQAPTATAIDVYGADLPLTVSGEQTNVGTGYTATASLTYQNRYYVLKDSITLFDILPEPDTVIVVWGNTLLTYNGSPQAPTATATGAKGEILELIVTGEQTDAGKGYLATASLSSTGSHYVLENTTTLFEIAPALISVQWGGRSFAYNGNPQIPTAKATGVKNEDLPVNVTGAQINVGTEYLATASVNAIYDNYTFNNLTASFDITPEMLAITAISVTIDYGQTPALNYAITSGRLFENDTLTGALSVETLQATSLQPPYPPGIHVIAQGTLTAGNNYLINFTEGTLTVISHSTEIFDILVNNKSTERKDDIFYSAPAENGEDQALVNVISNIFGTITIHNKNENPQLIDLSKYGENHFIITITAPSGNSQDYTLVIERYYEKVFYEYPDVPTINCNSSTNGGFTFTGFQWYKAGEAITDATGPYFQVKDNATYHCELTPNDGLKIRTIDILPQATRSSNALMAYPNPTKGKVTLLGMNEAGSKNELPLGFVQNQSSGKLKIQVFNIYGVLVMQPETNPFDMRALPEGLYFLTVNGETAKVLKTN